MDDLISPAPPLKPFVEGYWFRRGVYQPSRKVRVLADACTKIIFELVPMPWPSAYVIGTQLSPIIVSLTGEVDRIGVRFRPGMAWFFLNISLNKLAGRLTPLEDLAPLGEDDIFDRLREASSTQVRTTMLDSWLLSLLRARSPLEEEISDARRLSRALLSGSPPCDLAAAMGCSERQLQRMCRERFGASAANLHRFHRFELLQTRLHGRPMDLADLAAELGFSDQSHMAREFRHFAGTTISALLRERASVGNIQDSSDWLPVLRKAEESGAW